MKTLLAFALAAGLSLAGVVTPAAADRPGVGRQPVDPWASAVRHHEHRGGWDGRRDDDRRDHWDRRDDRHRWDHRDRWDDRHGHHWHRGRGYGYRPPLVIHPPHRPYRTWVPGRWAWNGWSWIWFPGYWTY